MYLLSQGYMHEREFELSSPSSISNLLSITPLLHIALKMTDKIFPVNFFSYFCTVKKNNCVNETPTHMIRNPRSILYISGCWMGKANTCEKKTLFFLSFSRLDNHQNRCCEML